MKYKKNICFILIFFMVLFSPYIIYAVDTSTEITEQGKSWLETGENNKPNGQFGAGFDALFSGRESVAEGDFKKIAGILQGLGIFVIAIVGVILGIQLMIASPENKAKVKQRLLIYLVGSVIIIAAVGIWQLMVSILDVV